MTHQPRPVQVITTNLDDDILSSYVIDHAKPHHRNWLRRHIHWALNTHNHVELITLSADSTVTFSPKEPSDD